MSGKTRSMKQTILSVLGPVLMPVLLATTISTTVIQPAHAVIGALLISVPGASIPLFVLGSILGVGGFAGAIGAAAQGNSDVTGSLLIGLIGTVLLDEQGNPTVQLNALSSDDAAKYDLTADELSSYNQELPMINALNQQNTYDGAQLLAQGVSQTDVQQQIRSEWTAQAAQTLSPATVSAVGKLQAAL